MRYTTALREGTADPEAILRRFQHDGPQHPTYRALAEIGKAEKTIFLCRYSDPHALRREIHEALNVIENWNSAISFIFFGKGGEVAMNRLEDQKLSVLALHLSQASLVYIDTLMLQRVLEEPVWLGAISGIIGGITGKLASSFLKEARLGRLIEKYQQEVRLAQSKFAAARSQAQRELVQQFETRVREVQAEHREIS